MDEVVLFGVGSDGSVPQFDGGQAPKAVMLRWLQAPGLSFPDFGYELERARIPDLIPLDWNQHVNEIEGRSTFEFQGGAAVLSSDQPLALIPLGFGPGLVVPPDGWISVRFHGPAWWTVVRGRPSSSRLVVQGLASGVVKVEAPLLPGVPVDWRTRGMDEIRVTGDGIVESVQYQALDAKRGWNHIAHLCLPVLDPRYPCAPTGASDEDVAAARVPPGVDWATRYSAGFRPLDALLVALATRTSAPAAEPSPAVTSTTTPAPVGHVDPDGALQLALLDPHLARAVGVLYDDPVTPNGLDGTAWAYRVVGRWAGPVRTVELTPAGLRAAGVALAVDGRVFAAVARAQRSVPVAQQATLDLSRAAEPPSRIDVRVTFDAELTWELVDADGVRRTGVLRPDGEEATLVLASSTGRSVTTAALSSAAAFTVTGLTVAGPVVERSSLLPYVVAAGAQAPAAPAGLDVAIGSPGGAGTPLQASLRWDTSASVDAFSGGVVTYQAAGAQLTADPRSPQPAAPPFDSATLLDDGALTLIPPATVAAGDPMAIDRPLPEGWRAWWVRGVDLFGRVSVPAGPEVRALVDDAPPPSPVILSAEYAQVGLDPQMAALLGQSSAGAAWIAGQPATGGQSAAVVTFGWTPDLDAQCGDVDAFRVYARTPAADGTWVGRAWGAPIGFLGSFPVRFAGTVNSIAAALAAVAASVVEPVDDRRSRVVTDLTVDVAGGLVGVELLIGGTSYLVVSHGEGDNAVLVVEHVPGAPPPAGAGTLRAAGAAVRRVGTTIAAPALSSDPHRRRVAGALLAGAARFVVVARDGTDFLITPLDGAAWPASGDVVTWYPAYRVAVADNGFGPRPSATTPAARVQLAVSSVRRSTVRPAESPPSTPALVHAVDTTRPTPPTLGVIPTGERCAQLASAADWHGISRFTLTWSLVPGATGYHVHRAMQDGVRQADTAVHGVGAASLSHAFPQLSLPSDAGRRAAVLVDLAALDTALRGGDAAVIRAAYAAMRADAWQLIASQDAVAPVFVNLNGVPLDAATTWLEDRFDGVTDAHWFYRVSTRNAAGLTSGLSSSTPPICAPRTTPPRPPRALLTLAGTGAVTLRFAPSPSAGVARYLVYRTYDRAVADDVRDMLEHARLTPDPSSPATGSEVQPVADGAALRWTDATASPGRAWFYRIVAEDSWGNRSEPSTVLTARSLYPPPDPPVWAPFTRTATTVHLSWTHAEPRLACVVERRFGGGPWSVVGERPLPRGVYAVDDEPPVPTISCDYRLTVLDHEGHTAGSQPLLTVPGMPR